MTAFPFGELVEEDNVAAISVTWEVILHGLRLLSQDGNSIKLPEAVVRHCRGNRSINIHVILSKTLFNLRILQTHAWKELRES